MKDLTDIDDPKVERSTKMTRYLSFCWFIASLNWAPECPLIKILPTQIDFYIKNMRAY